MTTRPRFKEVAATKADKPYLIEPQAAITTAHETPLEFSNKQIPASKIADGDFIGTYKYRNLPATENGYGNYIFGFNTQKFNYVKSTVLRLSLSVLTYVQNNKTAWPNTSNSRFGMDRLRV